VTGPRDAGLPVPVALLGLGRVGRFLALHLAARGIDVRGWDREGSPTVDDVRAVGVPVTLGALPASVAACPLLIVAVADRAIEAVAAQVGALAPADGAVVLHTSGFHPAALLRPHLPPRVAVGSLHPVHAFAAGDVPAPAGIPAALEGEPAAVAAAGALARTLGLLPFTLAPGQKALYHAALALLSNGTVGLFAVASALLERAGVPADPAHTLLTRLLGGTASNLEALSPARALTGPVQRGDDAVVQAHLAAVARAAPAELELFRAVVGRLARLVAEEPR